MQSNKLAVAKVRDLAEGELKRVEIDGNEIVLCKVNGTIYANSAVCPHYGAPLEEGVLSGTRLICPWHHAAFDVSTGGLLEPPANDCLHHLEVEIQGQDVNVRIPANFPTNEQPKPSRSQDKGYDSVYVIMGAGAAGNAAAQALRELGFSGRIRLMTREDRLPYDRPSLSKAYIQGAVGDEEIRLRSSRFYDKLGIELATGVEAVGVDSARKKIQTRNGPEVVFDKLLLAVGGQPRQPVIAGIDLDSIYSLRTYDDARAIIDAAENSRRVVMVGSSFIVMELSYNLKQRGLEVDIVAPEKVPFEMVFGTRIGQAVRKTYEEAGIRFHMGRKVERFSGNGSVQEVILDDNTSLVTDMVVIGIGVKPASETLRGVPFERDGSVRVDEYLKVEPGVYAAGDVACFPDWRTGKHVRIEHWRTAEQQGRVAARNMVGDITPFRSVPFFWTTLAGKHYRYVGHATDFDDTIIHGDIENNDFIAYYVKDDRILSVAGSGRDRELAAAEELMRQDRLPDPNEIGSKDINLVERLKQ